jgi:hypothetical protein
MTVPRRGRVARKYRRYCLTPPIVKFLGIIVLILTVVGECYYKAY